eukprot:11530853-Prorocentrum_lima.AAC.1
MPRRREQLGRPPAGTSDAQGTGTSRESQALAPSPGASSNDGNTNPLRPTIPPQQGLPPGFATL